MTDFRTDEEKLVDDLELRITRLEDAIDLLISNCLCTAGERYSGHLVDCPVPHLKELMHPSEEER